MSKESKDYKNMPKKIYIRTFGCQMNDYDSQLVEGMMEAQGYKLAKSEAGADVILFNGCSVRKHAEDRVWGNINNLKTLKKTRPGLIIGLIGCMGKNFKEKAFEKAPVLDIVAGPQDIYEIPRLVRQALEAGGRRVAVGRKVRPRRIKTPGVLKPKDPRGPYVAIMEGCDNFCSYCIVPYVRGRQKSRPAQAILREVRGLINKGYSNIVLLGQNVSAYHVPPTRWDKSHRVGGTWSGAFVQLLEKVNGLEGIKKVSFITSHPKDVDERLFKAMRDLEHVAKELHLPLQSGSNRILKLMKRGYTRSQYLKKVELLRKHVPGVRLTTDVIVGFPGEKEKDFKDTLDLMKKIRFDAAYIFKYSPRPPAKASRMKDDVPVEVKKRRNQVLLDLQKRLYEGRTSLDSRLKHSGMTKGAVVFLLGPTGVGKTEASVKLAKELGAEIVCCDSMQVYKGMQIMTSQPSAALRRRVPHHLYGIIDPRKPFSAADFRKLALEKIKEIHKRGKVPLFVGGTGFYASALIDGLFKAPPADWKIRNRLAKEAEKSGSAALHRRLKKIDPPTAKKIHSNDTRRLIRALEVHETTGSRMSELKKNTKGIAGEYDIKIKVMNMRRDLLYKRIDARVEKMFRAGLVGEVRRLRGRMDSRFRGNDHVPPTRCDMVPPRRWDMVCTAGKALGYGEVCGYLDGECSKEEAKELLKKNTRNYAKRQLTWFRGKKYLTRTREM